MAVINVNCKLTDIPPPSIVESFWDSAVQMHAATLVDDVGAQMPTGLISGGNPDFLRLVADTTGKRIDNIVARSTGCDFNL